MALDLSRCWTETPIAVIDTETTGLSNTDAICEIAVTTFVGGCIVAEFATLVRPPIPIPLDATKIHGITNAMVANAPSIEEAASGIFKVAADAVPCAFNAPFDRRFFHRVIQGNDCPAFDPQFPWLDVYVIVSSPRVDKFEKGKGRLKLSACCARHGVPHESQHRAFGDTRATGALLWRLHEKGLVKACSIGLMLKWAATRSKEQDVDRARYRARCDAQNKGAAP